ncbi:MAG: YbjN domain-containing protein [Chloroflexi bacterium]|nr:YbjN domain-containing protein [Chloroflexota bacterium]
MAERPYGRVEWFDSLYGRQERSKAAISPPEAQAMVDRVFASLGIDPQEATDEDGWRHLGLGTAHAMVNVLEWDRGEYSLAVWSPILRSPQDVRLRAALFEDLLRLNHHAIGQARVSLLEGDLVAISVLRPIADLEADDIVEAIRAVLEAADRLDEPLQKRYEVAMPNIEMDRTTWETVRDVLRLCDPYAQRMFSYLMEGWVARKGRVTTGKHTIGLDSGAPAGKTLAALIGGASAGPIVTVGWNSLARQGLRPADEVAFKGAIPRPPRFEITESSAHLPVDDSFTEAMADQFLNALAMLDKALRKAEPVPPPKPPDLEKRWGLKINVGGATQRGIDALLEACSPEVRKVYILLIQGWHDAGQKLYTKTLNSVALRLSVYSHTFALCSLWAPSEKPAYLWLYYPLFHLYFRGLDEARLRYEQGVARMPGFTPQNSGASITVDEAFTDKSAKQLLKLLSRLGEDVKPTLS